jgi:DNA-binding transcriptional ArsR family regulator
MTQRTSTADLLLHPVRLRILQTLLGGRQLTTAQLQQQLPDVSAATVYRQVATLVEAGVLEVAGERRVRGAVERSYALLPARASVAPQDVRAMSPAQHRSAFLAFVAGVLADFDRYVEPGDVDFERDLAGYRQAAFYATDEEAQRVVDDVRTALAPWLDRQPAPGRRRRVLTTVLLPATEPDPPAAESPVAPPADL